MGSFFDSLYSRFILRDMVAKVVPGFIALFALTSAFRAGFTHYLGGLSRIGDLVTVFVLYGISFMTGMLLQFIGQSVGFFRIHVWPATDEMDARKQSLRMALELQKSSKFPESVQTQRERFAILKEMSANFGMALLIVSFSLFIGAFLPLRSPRLGLICLVPIAVGISVVLFRQSRCHADEQLTWESQVLGKEPK